MKKKLIIGSILGLVCGIGLYQFARVYCDSKGWLLVSAVVVVLIAIAILENSIKIDKLEKKAKDLQEEIDELKKQNQN